VSRPEQATRPWAAILAGIVLTVLLGSIHAFSILINPLEALYDARRQQISLFYSGALVFLTVSVLISGWLFRRFPAWFLGGASLVGAAAGLAAMAVAVDIRIAWLGYAVLFGGANGVGYVTALHLARCAFPVRKGTFMGLVTATYAMGATGFGYLFVALIGEMAVLEVIALMAVVMAAVIVPTALVIRTSGVHIETSSPVEEARAPDRGDTVRIALYWLAYGSAVLAGLLTLGHAAEIAAVASGDPEIKQTAIVTIAAANAMGGILAGLLADRLTVRLQLIGLPLLSIAGLVILSGLDSQSALLVGLALVGGAYGAIIVAYPVAIVDGFGSARSASVYGRVFTAWGVAGLSGPWLAGLLFDMSGGYDTAIQMAIGIALLSVLIAFKLRTSNV
jgi:OFA family oxalate/formate antiporter-like MFS transporter